LGPGLLQQPVRFALALGLVVAGGLLLYELVGVVEVFALALIMALALAPAVDFLVGLGLPRFLALLVVLCALAVGIGLLGYIVAPLLFEQVGDFARRAPAVARGVQDTCAASARTTPVFSADQRAGWRAWI
jgi:predicted PurR-regulated permease PerM